MCIQAKKTKQPSHIDVLLLEGPVRNRSTNFNLIKSKHPIPKVKSIYNSLRKIMHTYVIHLTLLSSNDFDLS